MISVLGIDTCDRSAGVAVVVDGAVRCSLLEAVPARHSVRLLALLEAALAGAGMERADLSLVGVTCGPGSFTGLRVGLATAKAIAFSLGIPAVGVSSLETLARSCMPFPGVVVPVLDARKQQVYASAVEGMSGRSLLPEAAWDPPELARAVQALEQPALFLGSGLSPYADVFARVLERDFLSAVPSRHNLDPATLAFIATERYHAGAAVPPAQLAPIYRRLSEAEEARQRRRLA